MRTKVTLRVSLISLVLASIGLASQEPGIVNVGYSTQLFPGDRAPTIPLIGPKGQQKSLAQISQPVMIVAFVKRTDSNEGSLDARVAALAQRFQYDHVTVAQVDIGSTDNSAVSTKNTHASVLLLHDPNQIVWKAFQKPAADTVFLINERQTLEAIGTLDKPKKVIRRTEYLNRLVEQDITDLMAD